MTQYDTYESLYGKECIVWIAIITEAIALFEKHGYVSTSHAYTPEEQVTYWNRQGGGVLARLKGIDYEWAEYVILKDHTIHVLTVPRDATELKRIDFAEYGAAIELHPREVFHLRFIAEQCVKAVWALGLTIENVEKRAPTLNLSGGYTLQR